MNTVEAASSTDEALMIEELLRKHHPSGLYADVWRIGCNWGLRVTDLLAVKYSDLDLGKKELRVVESKTGSVRDILLTPKVLEIIKRRREANPEDIYLFQAKSNNLKGEVKPMHRGTLSKVLCDVSHTLSNLPLAEGKRRINTHSMRKTKGMSLFRAKVPLEEIARSLGHRDSRVTARYLGIDRSRIMQSYADHEI